MTGVAFRALTVLVQLVVGFTLAWMLQDQRYGKQMLTLRQERADAIVAAAQQAAAHTTSMQRQRDKALEHGQKLREIHARTLAGLRSERDGLRQLLATRRAELSNASCDACREYASTVSELLERGHEVLADVAGKADGHALDALICQQAWPVLTP